MSRAKAYIASSVFETDEFYSLGNAAQALYVHLLFAADADGVVTNTRMIAASIEGGADALKELEACGYIVKWHKYTLIAHWWVNNKTDNRNYRPGVFAADLLAEFGNVRKRENAMSRVYQSNVSLTSVARDRGEVEIDVDERRVDIERDIDVDKNNTTVHQSNVSLTSALHQSDENHGTDTDVSPCPQCGHECVIIDGVVDCPVCGIHDEGGHMEVF